MKEGDWYSQKKVRKGFQKTQEVYGSLGYYEFTGYPEPIAREDGAANGNGGGEGSGTAEEKPATKPVPGGRSGPAPIVDVTMRLQEGKQYFVNRITFVGNTTPATT